MKTTYTLASIATTLRTAAIKLPLERRYEATVLREAVEMLHEQAASLIAKNGGDKTFSRGRAIQIMHELTSQARFQLTQTLKDLHVAGLVDEILK